MNTHKITPVSLVFLLSMMMNSAAAPVTTIKNDAAFHDLLNNKHLVVAKFEAAYCGPCKTSKKPFGQVASATTSSDVGFAVIDVDVSADLAKQYNVNSVPTIIFFVKGAVADRITGMESPADFKNDLNAKIAQYSSDAAPAVVPAAEGSEPAENPMGAEQQPAAEGFMEKITGFLAGIFKAIMNIFEGIINKIKGLF